MRQKKHNWKLYGSLAVIVLFSWIENEYITESVGVEELKRKLLHFAFLAGIQLVGYWYWHAHPLKWMKQVWMCSYFALFGFLFFISLLSWKFQLFSTTFLDQIHYVRTFFCSPLPFIITIVLSKIDLRNAGNPAGQN